MENPYQAPQSELREPNNPIEGDQVLASRWARLFAAIIDSIIGAGIAWTIILFVMNYQFADAAKFGFAMQLMLNGMGVAIFVALHGYFLAQNGQTIGKKLIGIKIVLMDGNKPSFWTLIAKRYLLVWVVVSIPMLGGLLNLVNICFVFRKDKRCIHDLIAGTRVIKS